MTNQNGGIAVYGSVLAVDLYLIWHDKHDIFLGYRKVNPENLVDYMAFSEMELSDKVSVRSAIRELKDRAEDHYMYNVFPKLKETLMEMLKPEPPQNKKSLPYRTIDEN